MTHLVKDTKAARLTTYTVTTWCHLLWHKWCTEYATVHLCDRFSIVNLYWSSIWHFYSLFILSTAMCVELKWECTTIVVAMTFRSNGMRTPLHVKPWKASKFWSIEFDLLKGTRPCPDLMHLRFWRPWTPFRRPCSCIH